MVALSGDVALERSDRFAFRLAFSEATLEVDAGLRLVFCSDRRDRMDRIVRLAVPTGGLSRDRTVLPEEAGSAVPLQRANAASLVKRVGAHARSLAAEIGPIPGSSRSVLIKRASQFGRDGSDKRSGVLTDSP